MICLYHSQDLDGKCSAAIIKMRYPDCFLYPITYGDKFPWDIILKHDIVYMVDYSAPMSTMFELNKTKEEFTWIDHHKSSIDEYEEFLNCPTLSLIKGDRRIDYAACELCYLYAFPGLPIPDAVQLLGAYDIFRDSNSFYFHNVVLPFQYGFRMLDTNPNHTILWNEIFSGLDVMIKTITRDGEKLVRYQEVKDKETAASLHYEVIFEGVRCIVMNNRGGSSQFKSIFDKNLYQLMLSYYFNGNDWVVSVYTEGTGIDCAEIAKKYGGGGHKSAAGFVCMTLPWEVSLKC